MKTITFLKIGFLLGAIGLVQGCTVGPNYHAPVTTMPSAFTKLSPATQPTVTVDTSQWWKTFDDPELDSLISRAVQANPDVQIALAHLQEARTFEYVANGNELPYLEASGAAGRGSGTNSTKGRIPGPLNAGSNTTGLKEVTEIGGLDALWDLDLFGGLRRATEAARYDKQAAAEARNDAMVFASKSPTKIFRTNSKVCRSSKPAISAASPLTSTPRWPNANSPRCKSRSPPWKPPAAPINGGWRCCLENSPKRWLPN
jgi:hypothetical protein